jgi:hypothetical protein
MRFSPAHARHVARHGEWQTMLVRSFAGTTILLAAAVAAVAEPLDAKAVFYGDDVLRKAVGDVARMQEPELRAFTRYLAECDDGAVDPTSRHACAAAKTAYQIEFEAKRPLDDLMYARSELEERSLLKADPEINDPRQIYETAKRKATVLVALERAAGDRFRALKSSRK